MTAPLCPFTGKPLTGGHDYRAPSGYRSWIRGEARPRKDRHVPYGPVADVSPVERTSERASTGNLNRSETDRWDRRRQDMAGRKGTNYGESVLDAVVAKGGMDALSALAALRESLNP